MIDDDQAPAFDDLAGEDFAVDKPPKTKRNLWRLGHRRPWWQWNVLTLFAALFVLVWVRELARVPQTVSWMACLAILIVWALGPLPSLDQTYQRVSPPMPRPELDESYVETVPEAPLGRVLAVTLAVPMFVGVLLLGGVVVFILAVIGAMMLMVAAWNRPI